jgi:hypothetical protein
VLLAENHAGECEAVAQDTEHPANVFGTEEAHNLKGSPRYEVPSGHGGSPGYGQDAELLVQNLQSPCCR